LTSPDSGPLPFAFIPTISDAYRDKERKVVYLIHNT